MPDFSRPTPAASTSSTAFSTASQGFDENTFLASLAGMSVAQQVAEIRELAVRSYRSDPQALQWAVEKLQAYKKMLLEIVQNDATPIEGRVAAALDPYKEIGSRDELTVKDAFINSLSIEGAEQALTHIKTDLLPEFAKLTVDAQIGMVGLMGKLEQKIQGASYQWCDPYERVHNICTDMGISSPFAEEAAARQAEAEGGRSSPGAVLKILAAGPGQG